MAKKSPFIALIAACGLLGTQVVLAQTCKSSITDKTPNSRYTVNNDGTVSDSKTRLMWAQCSQGQTWASNGGAGSCSGTVSTHTWQAALTTAEAVTLAGHSDWRLPNIKELSSLVAINCADPAINATIFPSTPLSSYFWSGSPSADDSSRAWSVYFDYGYGGYYNKSASYGVRVVRDGQ
jgi:hypothetical protein